MIPAAEPSRLRAGVCSLGAFATVAQVMFARELVVAFLGNELVIGLVLAVWLTGIGVGAAVARRVCTGEPVCTGAAAGWLMVAGGAVLPLQFLVARTVRCLVGVPVGEVGSLGSVLAASTAVCLPTALVVGLAFPLLCAAAAGRKGADASGESSGLYCWESAGSMLAGASLTWVLLPVRGGIAIAVMGCGVALLGAACLLQGMRRTAFAAAASVLLVAGAMGWPLAPLESASVTARWRAAGLLIEGSRLVDSRDTVYQNLALLERQGQYSLYANGAISVTFPDRLLSEHEVHAVMAQKPAAGRVLLLGGNPLDDVRELLRYPLERLVHVDLDPGVGRMVRAALPAEWSELERDGRLVRVEDDVPRYLKHCREKFDVILVRVPDPFTLAANRCFTKDFYGDARRRLREGGMLVTTVTLSARLQTDSATLGSSVYRAIQDVFPIVLVSAGARPVFVAGTDASDLTMDREVLARRSRGAGIKATYFRPEYLLGTDDYDPEMIANVRETLTQTDAHPNSMLRPVATTYSLALWRRFSGTGGWAAVWATILVALGAMIWSARHILPEGAGTGSRLAGWIVCGAVGTTGLVAIAIEILLILLFQSAYGYVYTRIGLVFAMFMLGLALGARSGRRLAASEYGAVRALVSLELAMAGLSGVVLWMQAVSGVGGGEGPEMGIAIYACTVLTGWVTGAEFPVAVRILTSRGGAPGAVVAAADTSDHAGAAVGAIATVVLMVPWLGVGVTALVLVALKLMLAVACRLNLRDRRC